MKRLTWTYYGFQFFFSLLLWLPIFYEYQKAIGLSDPQIFAIQSLYYTVFCFLELPTGFIADRFGCKKSAWAGCVTLTIANFLPVFFKNYDGFLLHFLLIALARSLVSGAGSAYLYEQLKNHNAVSDYKQIEGNARAFGLIGKVAVWPAAGFLMTWQLESPYWITGIFSLVSVFFATALPREATQQRESHSVLMLFVQFARPLLHLLRVSPRLILLMLQGVGIFVLARIVQVNLFQPILKLKGLDVTTFGTVMAVMTVFEAIGSARPQLLRKFFDDTNAVFALTAIIALSVFWMGSADQWGTVAALCLYSIAVGFSFPIQRQLINDSIEEPKLRATLLSMESIIDRAVCALVVPFIGSFVEQGRLVAFLNISATTTLVVIAILYGLLRFVTVTRRS